MGDTIINYTPRGEGSSRNFNVSRLGGLFRFEGYKIGDRSLSITVGGTPVGIINDSYFQYTMEIRAIGRDAANPTATDFNWVQVSELASHVSAGGQFEFRMDNANTFDDTTTVGNSKGDTTLTVSSTTGLADGDLIYIEDVDDSTKWQISKVNGTPTATVITVHSVGSCVYSYGSGSIVRDWEYFPDCVAIDDIDFAEREGGQGVNLWDFRMRFRTVAP